MLEHIIDFIAPNSCLSCRQEGSLLCSVCIQGLPKPHARDLPLHLDSLVIASNYTGYAKDLLHQLKFGRASAAATPIAAALGPHIDARGNVLLVPVPTATTRVRQRGYDQADRIASSLSKLTGAPCVPLLARMGQQRQVGSTREERHSRLTQAFRATSNHVPPNTRLILIDDVITTGSTLSSAAHALRQAGYGHIEAAVFAGA